MNSKSSCKVNLDKMIECSNSMNYEYGYKLLEKYKECNGNKKEKSLNEIFQSLNPEKFNDCNLKISEK